MIGLKDHDKRKYIGHWFVCGCNVRSLFMDYDKNRAALYFYALYCMGCDAWGCLQQCMESGKI